MISQIETSYHDLEPEDFALNNIFFFLSLSPDYEKIKMRKGEDKEKERL